MGESRGHVDAAPRKPFDQLSRLCRGSDADRLLERFRVAHACNAAVADDGAQEVTDLRHELPIVPADAIPLEHRELGLVPAAELVVAEHAAQLVDVAAACREQPFHRVLGRSVQVVEPRAETARARRDAFEREVRDAGRGQRRRLDLEHAARREESADQRVDLGSAAQGRERS